MAIDISTIEANLTQAKADVEFWESAKRILTDPRIKGTEAATQTSFLEAPVYRPYGSIKSAVEQALPAYGEEAVTSTQLVENLRASGFPLTAKQPGVAINDSLTALRKEGKAYLAGSRGIAKLWTKAEEKTEGKEAPAREPQTGAER